MLTATVSPLKVLDGRRRENCAYWTIRDFGWRSRTGRPNVSSCPLNRRPLWEPFSVNDRPGTFMGRVTCSVTEDGQRPHRTAPTIFIEIEASLLSKNSSLDAECENQAWAPLDSPSNAGQAGA